MSRSASNASWSRAEARHHCAPASLHGTRSPSRTDGSNWRRSRDSSGSSIGSESAIKRSGRTTESTETPCPSAGTFRLKAKQPCCVSGHSEAEALQQRRPWISVSFSMICPDCWVCRYGCDDEPLHSMHLRPPHSRDDPGNRQSGPVSLAEDRLVHHSKLASLDGRPSGIRFRTALGRM